MVLNWRETVLTRCPYSAFRLPLRRCLRFEEQRWMMLSYGPCFMQRHSLSWIFSCKVEQCLVGHLSNTKRRWWVCMIAAYRQTYGPSWLAWSEGRQWNPACENCIPLQQAAVVFLWIFLGPSADPHLNLEMAVKILFVQKNLIFGCLQLGQLCNLYVI